MFARILERLTKQDVDFLEHRRELKENLANMQNRLHARIDSNESAVRELEKSRWKQRGFVAAIAFVIPLLWQWVTGKA